MKIINKTTNSLKQMIFLINLILKIEPRFLKKIFFDNIELKIFGLENNGAKYKSFLYINKDNDSNSSSKHALFS